MTALLTSAPTFRSHLFPWQRDGIIEAYLRPDLGLIWAPGSGKGVVPAALAPMLLEDDRIDLVLSLAEATKVLDYVEDYDRFAGLAALPYENSDACRARVDKLRPPVLVTTYETARNALVNFRTSRSIEGFGPLGEYLRGKRVLFVLDETTKLANRGSRTYKAFNWALTKLRAESAGSVRTLATTATTLTRDPMSHWNIFRLLDPAAAGTVELFEKQYVAGWSKFRDNEPTAFKNLSPEDCDPGVVPLSEKFAHLIHRVRKTDPAVAPYFPRLVEKDPVILSCGTDQRRLMTAIVNHFKNANGEVQDGLYSVLRQVAGHPEALLAAEGVAAREVVKVVGEAGLKRLGSVKTDYLVEQMRAATVQQVVFTFYGQSTLPILQRELERAGVSVTVNRGGMTARAKQRAKAEFKNGDTQVYLSSDAGARGISLGNAADVWNFEPPTKYETYEQRVNRANRVDSAHPETRGHTLVAQNSPDAGALDLMLRRNGWQEELIDSDAEGEGHLTAAQRRAMVDPSYRTR